MHNKTLVYVLSLFIVVGAVGVISASAHGWNAGKLFSQEEVEAKIAQKLADGNFTQEQADAKLEWIADKQVKHDEYVADFAEFLGLSVEELEAQIEAGNNPREIAEAQGISEEDLKAYHQSMMQEKMGEKLQSLVDAGKLTQEEADQKLQLIEDGEWDGRMHKGFGKYGGKHKSGFGFRK